MLQQSVISATREDRFPTRRRRSVGSMLRHFFSPLAENSRNLTTDLFILFRILDQLFALVDSFQIELVGLRIVQVLAVVAKLGQERIQIFNRLTFNHQLAGQSLVIELAFLHLGSLDAFCELLSTALNGNESIGQALVGFDDPLADTNECCLDGFDDALDESNDLVLGGGSTVNLRARGFHVFQGRQHQRLNLQRLGNGIDVVTEQRGTEDIKTTALYSGIKNGNAAFEGFGGGFKLFHVFLHVVGFLFYLIDFGHLFFDDFCIGINQGNIGNNFCRLASGINRSDSAISCRSSSGIVSTSGRSFVGSRSVSDRLSCRLSCRFGGGFVSSGSNISSRRIFNRLLTFGRSSCSFVGGGHLVFSEFFQGGDAQSRLKLHGFSPFEWN